MTEREDSKISSQLRLYNLVMGDIINQDGEMGGPDLERENQVVSDMTKMPMKHLSGHVKKLLDIQE